MRNVKNVDRFCEALSGTLALAVSHRPGDYAFQANEIPVVVQRMKAAFTRGSYNHDGYATRLACKAIGINNTRRSMEEYFERVEP